MDSEYKKLGIDPTNMEISSAGYVVFSYKKGKSRDKVYTQGSFYYGYIASSSNGYMWSMRKVKGGKDKKLVDLAQSIIEHSIIREPSYSDLMDLEKANEDFTKTSLALGRRRSSLGK